MSQKLKIITAMIAAGFVSTQAQAVQIDGFLTAGGAFSDEKTTGYLGSINDDVSFETDSRFGLQISSEIDKNMSVVGQLLASGGDDNYNAIIEWAYVDYSFNKQLSLRAGKIKEPVFLISDYVEVGYAYPWIRPPAEVYSNNPLNTVNGMELLYRMKLGKNTLSFQPYFGTNNEDIPGTGGAGKFQASNIVGADIKYAARGYSVHLSSLKTDVTTTGSLQNVPINFPTGPDAVNIDLETTGVARLTSIGFTADVDDLVIYSEAQSRKITGSASTLFPKQDSYYFTLGYRVGKWMPHFTLAHIQGGASITQPFAVTCSGTGTCPANAPVTNFFPAVQTSMTYGGRYEVNDSAAFKIEYQIVDIETDKNNLGSVGNPGGSNFGLFDQSFTVGSPTEKVGILSVALDVIF